MTRHERVASAAKLPGAREYSARERFFGGSHARTTRRRWKCQVSRRRRRLSRQAKDRERERERESAKGSEPVLVPHSRAERSREGRYPSACVRVHHHHQLCVGQVPREGLGRVGGR